MAEVHKKLSKKYFDLIQNGEKTFEFRVADYEINPGDILVLEEYEYENDDDTTVRKRTGRTLRRKVGYVGKTKDFKWLERPDIEAAVQEHGFQIISLMPEEAE